MEPDSNPQTAANARAATPAAFLATDDLREIWPVLSPEDRVEGFRQLERGDAEDFFLELSPRGQSIVVLGMPAKERRLWMRLLEPDDAADLLQGVDEELRPALLALLDEPTRDEVVALMAYAEDAAGGLMSPRFAHVRPNMTAEEAIRYLRRQARENPETLYYVYALDAELRLRGVVSVRQLFSAPAHRRVEEFMETDLVSVPDDLDQEAVARLIASQDLMAVPVVDAEGRMRGIVTVDDIVDVVEEEATEDIQKLGGMEALDHPYLQTGVLAMVQKRAGWLAALFLGEMLTTGVMARYEHAVASAVVLAVFVPLIISSGGNSGSQATTLVIRAMALGEVRLRDWWRVARREVATGAVLGLVLATIGFGRIVAWEGMFGTYGDHAVLLALTVALSLMGVVLWGTVAGSMLPFLIRRLGFDPASASAPFVATLVDVFGLVIYFTFAGWLLTGALL